MSVLPVTIFSDFTCPFSYVTETALRRRTIQGGIEIAYRAFELYPAPAPLPEPEAIAAWEDALRPLASEVGIELRMPAFSTRTGKAHEAAAFAREQGHEAAMREAIFEAYWRDGSDIGRIDVLVELAIGIGLDRTQAKVVLDVDRHAEAVVRDRADALRAGIHQTPTTIIGSGPESRVIVGAFPYGELVAAIEAA